MAKNFIADLHIHSRFSRATSKDLTLAQLDKYASKKGVDVLGTGDFTHPGWIEEIQEELEESSCPGLYVRKKDSKGTHFMLTCEVSGIYSRAGSVRRVHTLLFAPSIQDVLRINQKLGAIGNLKSDGRPILGLDVQDLTKIVLDINENCMVVPAHIWTPWFSVFGSKSGFNSLAEAFSDMEKYIFAVETGLSSDPPMNWRVSGLDKISLISNSDSHSAPKIAREANVFSCDMSYFAIREALKNKELKQLERTLEFFPEEGKYHYDGHRVCGFSSKPKKETGDICRVCGKVMTIGVLSRVEELADREEGIVPENSPPYTNIVPLEEIIASCLGVGVKTKKVGGFYENILNNCGKEIDVLINVPLADIGRASSEIIQEGVRRMREGAVSIEAGYDGEYGKVSIFKKEEKGDYDNNQTLGF